MTDEKFNNHTSRRADGEIRYTRSIPTIKCMDCSIYRSRINARWSVIKDAIRKFRSEYTDENVSQSYYAVSSEDIVNVGY